MQAAPILNKICVSRTCFLKMTSSHCQFACYGPNKKAYDRLEKYLLRVSSKINLWSKFLQFPANSMSCSCSVLPQCFALLCLTFFSVGRFWQLLFSLLFAPFWLGVVLVVGQMIWDFLGWFGMPALRPVVLLTQLSPLCMTRHILDLAKSRKELRRRRLVGFETTLTSPKALGWVHPRLHFTLSAAVAPQLHSEGDKTCVHMSAGRKQSCFQGISVTPSCQR